MSSIPIPGTSWPDGTSSNGTCFIFTTVATAGSNHRIQLTGPPYWLPRL